MPPLPSRPKVREGPDEECAGDEAAFFRERRCVEAGGAGWRRGGGEVRYGFGGGGVQLSLHDLLSFTPMFSPMR